MINNNSFKIIFIILFLFISKLSHAYEISVAEKYSEIFTTNILTQNDIINYRQAYVFQEECKWKSANKHILKISNKILMGHILAQRYLHPKCYRSNYLELYYWLQKYNDLPQAKRIYRLAIKRMPKGYKSPTKPIKPTGIVGDKVISKKSNKYKSSKKLSKNQRIEKQKLINAVKSRVNRGWPTGAVKILQQRDVNLLLDQVELDQQKELIAKGYFLANKNDLAVKYASEALVNSSARVPYAAWTAGLASWRLKEYKKAADFFSLFSISLKDDAWHQTSGSFWAARSYAKLGQYNNINFWLERASQNPNSFYGMLALEILGIDEKIYWGSNNTLNTSNSKLLNLPSGKRLQSLIQVGFNDELEKEIVHINSVLNKEIASESVKIAQHFNLAYTQLKIVNKLEQFGLTIETGLYYPTPIWEPRGGFNINKELIYAFMHQESMFNAKAKSNQGAVGLMQVLPSTAKFITSSKDVKRSNSNILTVPEINLEVGQEYIEYLLDLELVSNNLIYLAAAYNGGPGNLKKWKQETNYLDDPLFFMESIPSRETRWFIEKILTKYWIYQNKNQKEMTSLKMLANGKDPLY
ncbi:MAG: lytic transglycosylase domain-containing protein [Pelagibacteraceae bacterium]|nr:lytic transglycosylase domain-containing protein [Pelagibacteraceae bacterium]MBT6355066.1 lytic transglycosylase domain-containing protein [Pelagibacteraceae bacterium]